MWKRTAADKRLATSSAARRPPVPPTRWSLTPAGPAHAAQRGPAPPASSGLTTSEEAAIDRSPAAWPGRERPAGDDRRRPRPLPTRRAGGIRDHPLVRVRNSRNWSWAEPTSRRRNRPRERPGPRLRARCDATTPSLRRRRRWSPRAERTKPDAHAIGSSTPRPTTSAHRGAAEVDRSVERPIAATWRAVTGSPARPR
jgi:hypothetical protein